MKNKTYRMIAKFVKKNKIFNFFKKKDNSFKKN